MNRVVFAAVDDLLFASKIRATAEHLGITVSFARNGQALLQLAEKQVPDLIIINLQAESFDPMELGKLLRQNEKTSSTAILGFFSHVQTEVAEQAKEAGFTHIMPRSAFSARLSDILSGSI